jgi:hypothetical protein
MATALSYAGACTLLMVTFVLESKMSPFKLLIADGNDLRFFWQVARRGGRRFGLGSATAGH